MADRGENNNPWRGRNSVSLLCRIYPVSHIECSVIGNKQNQTAYKLKYINMGLQEGKKQKESICYATCFVIFRAINLAGDK